MSAITGLHVVYGLAAPPPIGYKVIRKNLNIRSGGEYTYICYSKAIQGPPITDIQVVAGYTRDFPVQPGYVKIPYVLNKEVKGRYIYLCYTHDWSYPPITEVDVIQGTSCFIYPIDTTWMRTTQDSCDGVGGYYSYIIYRRT